MLLRVPVGTLPQPTSLPTRLMYSLLVAQVMNLVAASTFCDPAGIASAQAHSQLAPFGVTIIGACANATLSATLDCFGSLMNEAAMSVTDICYAVGFNNVSNFNRQFLRRKGMPPSRFRALLEGSAIRESHREGDTRVQDPYCIRCQPQVTGACLDLLWQAAAHGEGGLGQEDGVAVVAAGSGVGGLGGVSH